MLGLNILGYGYGRKEKNPEETHAEDMVRYQATGLEPMLAMVSISNTLLPELLLRPSLSGIVIINYLSWFAVSMSM